MSRRLTNSLLVASALLLAAPAALARPKARPPQSQPARTAPTVKVYRPPDFEVRGRRQVPIKLVFGRQAPAMELRPLERVLTSRLRDAVRRAPF